MAPLDGQERQIELHALAHRAVAFANPHELIGVDVVENLALAHNDLQPFNGRCDLLAEKREIENCTVHCIQLSVLG